MSLADLPDAFFRTILEQIAVLLLRGACGDMEAARQASVATLNTYDPRTEAEFRLAARILSCSLEAGEALAQAADPEMPLTRVMRLRSNAVALNREAEKAERRLEKLRAARAESLEEFPKLQLVWETVPEVEAPEAAEAPSEVPPEPPGCAAITIEETAKVAAYAEANGLSWSEAFRHRRREERLAERRRKEALRTEAA